MLLGIAAGQAVQARSGILMDTPLAKPPDRSRALLFGLLANCVFATGAQKDCPLWELRNNLSIEEKHEYVMGLSDAEVKKFLGQHECCYEKRLPGLMPE